jgi:hypothetical protein
MAITNKTSRPKTEVFGFRACGKNKPSNEGLQTITFMPMTIKLQEVFAFLLVVLRDSINLPRISSGSHFLLGILRMIAFIYILLLNGIG